MSIHTITSQVGSTPIVFETGKMGKLADGAVTVRCGDTIILVTAIPFGIYDLVEAMDNVESAEAAGDQAKPASEGKVGGGGY